MYICTHSLASMCSNSPHSQRNNHRIHQNTRPYITTRQTVPLQEEIIFLSSPPPPYTPRRTDLENESLAPLQPPPYAYATSIVRSNEQGTTPITSPPPYSPSTQL